VHKYFNPYGSPYEAFINYMNVLSDFMIRVDEYLEPVSTTQEKAGPATPRAPKTRKGKTVTKKAPKAKSTQKDPAFKIPAGKRK